MRKTKTQIQQPQHVLYVSGAPARGGDSLTCFEGKAMRDSAGGLPEVRHFQRLSTKLQELLNRKIIDIPGGNEAGYAVGATEAEAAVSDGRR